MPVAGRLVEMAYVPGRLFSVNEATAKHVPGLFARNERLVCIFETEHGPMAMVLVGAMIVAAIKKAGYKPGADVQLALDAASTEIFSRGKYKFAGEGKTYNRKAMVDLYRQWCSDFPIFSIEDGMAEDDWAGWKELTEAVGNDVQLVGDDLFVTNTDRLARGIEEDCGNSILIKVNQIGTLTETMDAISLAHDHGFTAVMSHRSGETEDSIIADLAVACGTGQIKTGAPCRSDRVAKYNQLLRIEELLGDSAEYSL